MQKTAFEESPDGFLEEFSRVTTGERHSYAEGTAYAKSRRQKSACRGSESSQEVADSGVARNGTDEAVELAF